MPDLQLHWWWLISATLLATGEIVLPGMFLLWLAIAAAATALLSWIIPGLNESLGIQLVLFSAFSVVAIYAGRSFIRKHPSESSDPQLNNRAGRLIGEIAIVADAIENGQGRVTVGDSSWSAEGPDMPAGSAVRIIGVSGTRLQIEPAVKK